MTGCTDPAHRHLHLAPVPCHACRAWLDCDGSAMSTQTRLERYPFMRDVVGRRPAQEMPDFEPTTGQAIGQMVSIAGALARTLIMVLIAGVALLIVVLFVVRAA